MKHRLLLCISLFCSLCMLDAWGTNKQQKQFKRINKESWKLQVACDMQSFDTACWVLDGLQGAISSSKKGLLLKAGPFIDNDSSHVVLWYKRMFSGDIKIEYDYTRMDTSRAGSVNIIYFHAKGSGIAPYTDDIMDWCDLRKVPAMKTYFNHMNTYHISYAVTATAKEPYDDYIRARQYNPLANKGLKGTDLKPDYLNNYLFKYGIKYHITVILRNDKIFMQVCGDNRRSLFCFEIDSKNKLTQGYVGFRQMWGRCSRYKNLKIYTIE